MAARKNSGSQTSASENEAKELSRAPRKPAVANSEPKGSAEPTAATGKAEPPSAARPVSGAKKPRTDGKVEAPAKSVAAAKTKSVEAKPVSAPNAAGVKPVAPGVAATVAHASAAKIAVGSTATQRSSQPSAPPVGAAAAKAVKASIPAKLEREEHNGDPKTMKTSANRHGFKLNEFVVYPAHGVGQIVSMEEQEVAGFKLELFVISFVKDKMTLRVPTAKVVGVGMRKLSDPDAAKRSLEILTGRARIKRTMWSRRAQEYEAKINSGDINAIAEVVRDLFRSEAQPEQSYSERQLYEAALDRMMREIAVVHKISETEAIKTIESQLKKNVKRGAKSETAETDEVEAEAEAEIEEAA